MVNWDQLYDDIKQMQKQGMTYREIAGILSERFNTKITRSAVKSAMRRRKYTRADDTHQELPQRLELNLSSFAVISDLHVPYHSVEMLNHVIAMMAKFDVDTLIINGDLSNQDQISEYPNDSPLQTTFHEEMVICGDMLVALDEELQAISKNATLVIVSGNHDERAVKRLGHDIRLEGLVYYMLQGRTLSSKLYVTSYDHCFINCEGNPWIVVHGSSYNKRPGEIAMRLAQKYRANVIMGHDHNVGFTSTPDGEYLAISSGSMIDIKDKNRTRLWYKERRLTIYPEMKNGFVIVKRGIPFLFDAHGSTSLNGRKPWSFWYEVDIKEIFEE